MYCFCTLPDSEKALNCAEILALFFSFGICHSVVQYKTSKKRMVILKENKAIKSILYNAASTQQVTHSPMRFSEKLVDDWVEKRHVLGSLDGQLVD